MDSMSRKSPSSSSDHPSSGCIDSPARRIRPYDDEFMIYKFKVIPCRITQRHDWKKCPFYHPGDKGKRRDPRKYGYTPLQCSKFRKVGSCEKGDSCEFAHGLFECWLHPGQYRTKLCSSGYLCDKYVCFFAHDAQELRQSSSVLLNQSSQSQTPSQFILNQGSQLLHPSSLPPPDAINPNAATETMIFGTFSCSFHQDHA